MDHGKACHTLSTNKCHFRLPPLPATNGDNGGNSAFWKIDGSDLSVRGLQALAELQWCRLQMGLQAGQVRIRDGAENAVSPHIARCLTDHGNGPTERAGEDADLQLRFSASVMLRPGSGAYMGDCDDPRSINP